MYVHLAITEIKYAISSIVFVDDININNSTKGVDMEHRLDSLSIKMYHFTIQPNGNKEFSQNRDFTSENQHIANARNLNIIHGNNIYEQEKPKF